MIKLIASDIDGTLLPEGTDQINPEIFEVIRKLKEKGIIFAAASGRHCTSMYRLFESVKNDIIFITESGAYVNCRGYDMLQHVIDRKIMEEWVKEVRQIPGTSFTLDTKECLYTESKDEEFLELIRDGYKSTVRSVDNVLELEPTISKMAIYRKTDIKKVAETMIPRWEGRMHCALAGDIWVDFMNKEANKGNAIRSIQETLGISPEETMVFGDNHNDLEMMESAAESYAVGNAAEAVKQAAKYVTDTNVNDGVLKVMKKLL
ncbi:MAG: HAD family phosphatase [Lachnospiraceae bacterium]|nr:HAD family phosphatase [Lachnospiraceae bacterium]